jgi:cation-transporting ATPase 13A2
VPPALVACLAIATAASAGRLWRAGISVSSSGHVPLAGLVGTVAFDKTGTLTQEGLELQELRLAAGGKFAAPVTRRQLAAASGGDGAQGEAGAAATGAAEVAAQAAAEEYGETAAVAAQGGEEEAAAALACARAIMAACHGLALVDGALVGDPLEVKLFEASGWRCLGEGLAGAAALDASCGGGAPGSNGHAEGAGSSGRGGSCSGGGGGGSGGGGTSGMVLEGPPGSGGRCTIVWRADFTSARQRSSVVVQAADGSLLLYAKVHPAPRPGAGGAAFLSRPAPAGPPLAARGCCVRGAGA